MQYQEHIHDKYIFTTKARLDALPDDNRETFDTGQLQLQCLEKFANLQGYRIIDGLITIDNPASKVISLNNMVALYNNTMRSIGERLKGQGFIETVYLSGRSLRKSIVVMKHKVKFL